jgi:hypothetical protein
MGTKTAKNTSIGTNIMENISKISDCVALKCTWTRSIQRKSIFLLKDLCSPLKNVHAFCSVYALISIQILHRIWDTGAEICIEGSAGDMRT